MVEYGNIEFHENENISNSVCYSSNVVNRRKSLALNTCVNKNENK
jgi:hypothetical protein